MLFYYLSLGRIFNVSTFRRYRSRPINGNQNRKGRKFNLNIFGSFDTQDTCIGIRGTLISVPYGVRIRAWAGIQNVVTRKSWTCPRYQPITFEPIVSNACTFVRMVRSDAQSRKKRKSYTRTMITEGWCQMGHIRPTKFDVIPYTIKWLIGE